MIEADTNILYITIAGVQTSVLQYNNTLTYFSAPILLLVYHCFRAYYPAVTLRRLEISQVLSDIAYYMSEPTLATSLMSIDLTSLSVWIMTLFCVDNVF